MAVVVGIDEAGLGPAIGPLVVSAVSMTVPDEAVDESLWQRLAGAVGRKSTRSKSVVAIDDSKKLYSRRKADGLRHLERGVLSMLAAVGCRPSCLGELLATVAPRTADLLAGYPWYADWSATLPRSAEATDIALSGNALKQVMASTGVGLRAMRAEPVLVGQYNQMVGATRNKSTTLFDVSARLLTSAWRASDGQAVYVRADRQGGRRRYRPALQRIFDGCRLKVVAEDPSCSTYEISRDDRRMEVSFTVGGEADHLPVALASMLSKYLRELLMEAVNGFWCGRVPELAPTAGYLPDGRRFFEAIEPTMRALGIDSALVYRTR